MARYDLCACGRRKASHARRCALCYHADKPRTNLHPVRSPNSKVALQMWLSGRSFAEIGRRLNISRQSAWSLVRHAAERAGDEKSKQQMEKYRAHQRKNRSD